MAHDKVYGICESKCKVEIMSKEEIEHENEEMIRRAVLIATGKEPLTDCTLMYSENTTITTLEYFETYFVTRMQGMFSNCSKLASIPALDTSNTTDMVGMFNKCTALKSIPVLDTSNVTRMDNMFYGCTALTSIPELDTSKVTNMTMMFYGCTALTSIPDLNMKSATDTNSMFKNCTSLTTFTDNKYALEGSRWQIKNNFDVSACPLDRESILKVFNGAQTVEGKTISISSTTNSYLSDEDKAIITDKGWTITVV